MKTEDIKKLVKADENKTWYTISFSLGGIDYLWRRHGVYDTLRAVRELLRDHPDAKLEVKVWE